MARPKTRPKPSEKDPEREIRETANNTLSGVARAFVHSMLRERADVGRRIAEAEERIQRGARATKHRFNI